MKIKLNCRHYKGDKPCFYHKRYKAKCALCRYYQIRGVRIIIIKLAAAGDVLRTTSILPGLKEKYKASYITWVTRKDAKELLRSNHLVDEVLVADDFDTLARLTVQKFDMMINLDNAQDSAAIAGIIKAKKRIGYGLDENGAVRPFNEKAAHWLEMAMFDDVKKANRSTYQDIMLKISGLNPKNSKDIILNLNEEELRFSKNFAKKNGIKKSDILVGVNTGGGTRWLLKRWTKEGYISIINMLNKKAGIRIMLFGGPHEKKLNGVILSRIKGKIIDGGCDNSLREFAALVNLCDVLVTGDSLGLHIGVALKKYVIALFGPTSSAEVELYGRGRKISPDMDCLCCYKPVCDKKPNCMEKIKVEEVLNAIKAYLKK